MTKKAQRKAVNGPIVMHKDIDNIIIITSAIDKYMDQNVQLFSQIPVESGKEKYTMELHRNPQLATTTRALLFIPVQAEQTKSKIIRMTPTPILIPIFDAVLREDIDETMM